MRMILKIVIYAVCGIVALIAVVCAVLGYKFYVQLKDGGKVVEWNDAEGTTYRNLKYGGGTRNTYNLVIPTDKQPDALMLFLHGGSWIDGEKEDMEYEVHRYAKMGYATATMNYSRLGKDTLAADVPYASPCFESMMHEIDACIKAIKAKGAELGCDFKQMAIGGYSAGGHLAMLYATRYATTSPIPLKFQISWVGPSDIGLLFPTDEVIVERIVSGDMSDEVVTQRQELKNFIQSINGQVLADDDCSLENLNHLKQKASPLYYVSVATPPAILAYGGKDGLVVAEHGKRMADALQKSGVDCTLVVFPNSGHELGQDKECTQSVIDAVTRFCDKYFD